MHINCPTPEAVLLCAVADAKGVLRAALPPGGLAAAGETPGLRFAVRSGLPINAQLADAASALFGVDVSRRLTIEQGFADPLPGSASGGTQAATLYLALLGEGVPAIVAAADWPSLPDILRRLAGRARLPYLRAWQVLAGGLQLNVKAVEATDAQMAKYFDEPTN